jgi:uncharacterized membrane protein
MKNIRKHWILVFGIVFGAFIWLPFFAPIFTHVGWKAIGNAIYFIYSFLCHQLPERSFFLFGARFTYSLDTIRAAGQDTSNISTLRHFIGNAEMGWKVAWSDRMVSMYTSLWIFGMLWWPLRKRLPRLPLWGFFLFLLPMAVDGGTHLLSDLAGIGHGFRDTNLWLSVLSGNMFRPEFYVGDTWGSFNSLMRLLTGILFGMDVAWFTFPHLDQALKDSDGPAVPRI